jgi:hypothetical protein
MTDNSPRLIGRREAAAYLGIAESTFSMWVATHKMPLTPSAAKTGATLTERQSSFYNKQAARSD